MVVVVVGASTAAAFWTAARTGDPLSSTMAWTLFWSWTVGFGLSFLLLVAAAVARERERRRAYRRYREAGLPVEWVPAPLVLVSAWLAGGVLWLGFALEALSRAWTAQGALSAVLVLLGTYFGLVSALAFLSGPVVILKAVRRQRSQDERLAIAYLAQCRSAPDGVGSRSAG